MISQKYTVFYYPIEIIRDTNYVFWTTYSKSNWSGVDWLPCFNLFHSYKTCILSILLITKYLFVLQYYISTKIRKSLSKITDPVIWGWWYFCASAFNCLLFLPEVEEVSASDMMPGSSSKSPDTLDEETAWRVGTACELDDPVVRYSLRFFVQVGDKYI